MERKTVNEFMNPELFEERKEKFRQQIIEGLNQIDKDVEEGESKTIIEESIQQFIYDLIAQVEYDDEGNLNIEDDEEIFIQFNQTKKQIAFNKRHFLTGFKEMDIYAEDDPCKYLYLFFKKYFHTNRWQVILKDIDD